MKWRLDSPSLTLAGHLESTRPPSYYRGDAQGPARGAAAGDPHDADGGTEKAALPRRSKSIISVLVIPSLVLVNRNEF